MLPFKTFKTLKLIYLSLGFLLLLSCAPKQVTTDLFGDGRGHGEGTLQDYYKLNYQAFFGAEHLAPDTAAVLGYLEYELSNDVEQHELPDYMPLPSYRHGYTRVALSLVKNKQIDKYKLAYAFIESAKPERHQPGEWAKLWAEIEQQVLEAYPELKDDELQAELRYAAENDAAVRHSDSYRNAYHPHYRIIRNDLLKTLK